VRRALGTVAALAAIASVPAAAQAQTAPRAGAAPAAGAIALELPLTVDATGLARFATAVSTPGSAQYGRYASVAALSRRFGATAATRARVLAYLHRAGATRVRIDATGLFADASMRVGEAERLFGTSLSRFDADSRSSGRIESYVAPSSDARAATVPAGLRGAVTGVVGLDTQPLAPISPQRVAATTRHPAAGATHAATTVTMPVSSGYPTRSGTPSGCATALAGPGFTPDQYLTAYGFSALQAAGLGGQGERVALIEIDGFNPADIKTFASCFDLPVPAIHAFGVGIDKALAPGAEATLDLELLDAAAPSLKEIDVYESEPIAADVLRSLTDPLSVRGRKPDVISASLGTCEADVNAAIGTAGIRTVEETLQLAAATGVSVLAASGDSGSTGCLSQKGTPVDQLAVDFPASSPWVTGVGGTNVTLSVANTIAGQVTWNDEPTFAGATGGGASIFPRPSYQSGVQTSSQREVPDVAMLADPLPGFEIYCSTTTDCVDKAHPDPWNAFGGTSAATPLLAGGLALVDEDLSRHDQTDLGFANPLLYSIARSSSAATTISGVLTGSNDLSESLFGNDLGCCTARAGYNEATGLGSVNLAGLATVARERVSKRVTVGLHLPARQRPLVAEHLLATVSCSGECLMGAYAKIQIGASRRRISAYSSAYELSTRHSRTINIGLSAVDRSKIRAALAKRQPVEATVYGAIIDLSGEIDSQTAGKRLRISS
jgi:subtilase family serine protease